MKKKFVKATALAGLIGLAVITPVHAGRPVDDVETLKHQMQQLIEQNQRLMSRVSQLEEAAQAPAVSGISAEALEKKVHKIYEQKQLEHMEDEDFAHMINKYVSFSGLIEVEGAASEDFEGVSDSGFELATVELGFDGKVTDWASGHVLILYEEGGDDEVLIDEGFITLGDTEQFPLYLNAGRLYVPFGNFESNMISDPLTLEIAETQESALQVGFEASGVYGSVFAFNGDTNEGGGDSQIGQFGANIGYGMEKDGFSLDVGVSYINSMVDSDGLTGAMEDEISAIDELNAEGEPMITYAPNNSFLSADYVGGFGAYAVAAIGPVSLIGEYITALEDYEMDYTMVGVPEKFSARWMAFNVEAGYSFNIGDMESTIALAYQGTDEMAEYLPESRILGSFAIGIFEGTTLAFEYAHDNDYDEADGGTDESADAFTAQLAYEF